MRIVARAWAKSESAKLIRQKIELASTKNNAWKKRRKCQASLWQTTWDWQQLLCNTARHNEYPKLELSGA